MSPAPTLPPQLHLRLFSAMTNSLKPRLCITTMTLIQLHLCSAKNLHCFCSTMRNLLCRWPPPPLQDCLRCLQ
ncbi:hypothetical protein AAHE18_10G071600 [Arachis hypogaea]